DGPGYGGETDLGRGPGMEPGYGRGPDHGGDREYGQGGAFAGPEDGTRAHLSAEDVRAYGEARLAALKAGLMLNAEQEKDWPAFEQAAREFSRSRLGRMA